MSDAIAAAADCLLEAAEQLRAATAGAGDDDLLSALIACEAVTRRLDHIAVETLATVDRRGVFTARGYRSTPAALADLLRWERPQARRHAVAAEQVIARTGLDGTALPAVLPGTATVFAAGEISLRHTEVIAAVLGTRAAARLAPGTWAAAEQTLADAATAYTPGELHTWGARMIERLDQDGPAPDDRPDPEINELRLVRHRHRPGGKLAGRFHDAALFDAIAAVLDAKAAPRSSDETREPAQRAAEALAEVCGYALEHGPTALVPDTGGRRPQLVVTIPLEELERRARAAMLEFGGQLSAESLRMLACDAAVIPVVLDGAGQPLDVGRATRTIPDGLRRAVTARDRGCAHPGCDRPPSWCECHHLVPWEQGGQTTLDNLVMLCRPHHRLIHHGGWTVRMPHGLPEFTPPAWIDAGRRPRRRPQPVVTTGDDGAPCLTTTRVADFADLVPP
jgi:5-methylcytosine-specific restriction protein A